ncbi:uncharacterized protein TRAVEDRAFT_21144 [Trametes versicolor FP-101664 SS1]|uniref:uncharacterized protein n=1 Tax=Trametes versicolor (strain FP-101664) TaxID=717944 RepID=UPI0004622312|nr:uncharacterized protein TRAVEDRAFT_21144 [Trametes versicolor FP-101664 SS1]EIW57567.1 hypothetical protein TRAVEDRAFT_21144 [Trametes versicolor FP-101664 SS1]
MQTITIHAIERGRAPSSLPRSARELEIAHFDVIIPPTIPLRVGQSVRVNSLTEAREAGNVEREAYTPAWYESTATGIEGRVIGIRTMELAITEFIIRNNDRLSLVEHAYLSIQHVQGITVHLGLWQNIGRTLLLPFLPHTRHIPIERDAIVQQDE